VLFKMVVALKPASFFVVAILVFKANRKSSVGKLCSIFSECEITSLLDTCRCLFLAWECFARSA
jgi:hypothetical protein